jgi:hypothetical protein
VFNYLPILILSFSAILGERVSISSTSGLTERRWSNSSAATAAPSETYKK